MTRRDPKPNRRRRSIRRRLLRRLRAFVITLSPQSRTSLAHHFGCASELSFVRKLSHWLHTAQQVSMLCDSTVALDVALLEAREEFVQRYRRHAQQQQQPQQQQ